MAALAPGFMPKICAAQEVERERVVVLERHLDRWSSGGWFAPYAPAVVGAIGLGGAATMALVEVDEGKDGRWYVVGGAAGLGVVSLGSYLAPIDYRGNIVAAALSLPAFGIALGAHDTEGNTAANDVTLFGFAGGVGGFSALSLVDLALTRPISSYTLYRHRQRLEKNRGRMTRAEIERMESDYALTERALPRWSFGVPLMLGGVVAFAPGVRR